MSNLIATFHTTFVELFQKDVIESPIPVVVDFYTEICPPCRSLAVTLGQLVGEFAGRVKFVKVDVASERELAVRYEIYTVPTLIFFVRGEIVRRTVGAIPVTMLRPILETLAEENN